MIWEVTREIPFKRLTQKKRGVIVSLPEEKPVKGGILLVCFSPFLLDREKRFLFCFKGLWTNLKDARGKE